MAGSKLLGKDGLNELRLRFIDEYMVDLNASAAYRRVRPAAKNADVHSHKLIKEPAVRAEVNRRRAALSKKAGVTVERIVAELALIGFANMADYMRPGADGDPVLDFSKLSRDQAAALTEVTVEDFRDGRGEDARDVRRVKFKLADKRAALVDLGKHLQMFVEKIEHSGKDGTPLVVNLISYKTNK